MYLIVGLGNPGREYQRTRHNVGFEALDELIAKYGIGAPQSKFRAMLGKGVIGTEKVIAVKPLTYMNLSGEAVRAVVDYYKIDPETELIVISDDVDLEPGRLRIRKSGSAGGHNGLKSIIQHLGTEKFLRIRIGVGGKKDGWDLADHVLGKIPEEERAVIGEALKKAAEAAACVVTDGADIAMNRYNTKKTKKEKKEKTEAAEKGSSEENGQTEHV
ncbi:MAG: aminoacyl-tRNA hydrolase [Lachnospiraceae bacterium]|nr:aminoacyl-tRNA hydrolase [Lachnospiraceae bacterium]